MSRPPIKAMESVKRYCEKKKTCKDCPLYSFTGFGYRLCISSAPSSWKIKKEGEAE